MVVVFSWMDDANKASGCLEVKKMYGGISRQGKIARTKRSDIKMNKDDIQLLFEYDRWANDSVLQAASKLSAEQFTRDLGGSFRSVRDTLVHIISGEWGWLKIFKEPALNSAFVTDLWTRIGTIFDPNTYPDVAAVRLKWAEVEREQVEFVSRVTDESLGTMLPVRATHLSLGHLMQHMANHSTYHRGQVSLMMRQLDAEPVATDFARFLLVGRPAVAEAH
jgi:uncharacterized damage-inducible protein DinB